MRRNALPRLIIVSVMVAGCGTGNPGPLGVGATPPPLVAEGWLNGPAPSDSDLAGKVVVLELWAYR